MKIIDHDHKFERRVGADGPYQRCIRDDCELERDYPTPRALATDFEVVFRSKRRGT